MGVTFSPRERRDGALMSYGISEEASKTDTFCAETPRNEFDVRATLMKFDSAARRDIKLARAKWRDAGRRGRTRAKIKFYCLYFFFRGIILVYLVVKTRNHRGLIQI